MKPRPESAPGTSAGSPARAAAPLFHLGTALACALVLFWGEAAASAPHDDDAPVDFGRDVRPILSNKCFACHGPDEAERQADLRLDLFDEAFRDLGGYFAIVPKDRTQSELYLRISDGDDPMPPPEVDKRLTPEEIETLGRWIDQGAKWEEHWSYVPPLRPLPPAITDDLLHAGDWTGPIDRFVLARLRAGGLQPSPEATKETLIRRVSLDLTGLPPSIEELDAFLSDQRPDAYDALVDRLLASPRYGEHMARDWLDAARYGDTHGFHLDNQRTMWRYRDWVIGAFNANMPFDQFTIEQLAGDLLSEPTLEQRIATGFNRCNPTTAEGGLIAEEYLVKYAVDRVDTTSTVWMGTTMACAQCHDHKFDPFSQRDFYRFFAFFNSISEEASDGNIQTPPPLIEAPLPEQMEEFAAHQAELAAAEARWREPSPETDAQQREWEARRAEETGERWHVLAPFASSTENGATLRALGDGSLLAGGPNPDKEVYELLVRTDVAGIRALRLDAIRHEETTLGGVGRADNSNFVLSELEVDVLPDGASGQFERVAFANAHADFSQPDYPVGDALDGNPETGWAIQFKLEDRTAVFVPREPFGFGEGTLLRIRLRFESRHVRHAIGRFRLSVSNDAALAPATLGPWRKLGPFPAPNKDVADQTKYGPEIELDFARTYLDGQLAWSEPLDHADGQVHTLEGAVSSTYLHRGIESPDERSLSLSLGSDDFIQVWLNGELELDLDVLRPVAPDQNRLDVRLRPGRNELVLKIVNAGGGYAYYFDVVDEELGGLPFGVARIIEKPDAERSDDERGRVREYYRRTFSEEGARLLAEIEALRERDRELDELIPRTMVMQERAERRQAHVLERGRYDKKGEPVEPGVPASLPPLPASAPANRLGLARWLVDDAHPLTARVIVNRYWQHYFGTGLVESSEDFGVQGSWPSHPELLDWLAVELVESGWDVKHLQKLIVTSAAYRQTARVTPELLEADRDNRLFARGPRFRLAAEGIRDTALYLGGLLVEEVGGPSVKPYQPAGLWRAVGYTSSNTANFMRDDGEALYRRSLYTFWKRTSPPPTMQLFDAPTREACTVRRARTNTPLQSLALMNDVQFVEAARAFAQRVLLEGGGTTHERIAFAFRSATSRRPDESEVAILEGVLDGQLEVYRADPQSATALIGVGESVRDASLDAAELAAWTCVTSMILNLDETVTKG